METDQAWASGTLAILASGETTRCINIHLNVYCGICKRRSKFYERPRS